MATVAENLTTAIENVAAQLAEITADPQPSYGENGRSISWGEHFNNLTASLRTLREQLALAEYGDAWEVRTRGIP